MRSNGRRLLFSVLIPSLLLNGTGCGGSGSSSGLGLDAVTGEIADVGEDATSIGDTALLDVPGPDQEARGVDTLDESTGDLAETTEGDAQDGGCLEDCTEPPADPCTPCDADDECGRPQDLCTLLPDGTFCTVDCAVGATCPEGYSCLEVPLGEGSAEQCLPEAGVCADCWDPDGDSYGLGAACLGPDCDEGNPDVYPAAEDLPDMGFTDTNCDGIDGDLADAVFVSNAGVMSSESCSKDEPCLTIDKGLAAAADLGRHQILVQAGIHEELVSLENDDAGVGIYGGYDATWARGPADEEPFATVVIAPEFLETGPTVIVQATEVSFQNLVLEGLDASGLFPDSNQGSTSCVVHAEESTLSFQGVTFIQGDGAAGGAGASGVDAPQTPAASGAEGLHRLYWSLLCGQPAQAGGAGGTGCQPGGAGGEGGFWSCAAPEPELLEAWAGEDGAGGSGEGGGAGGNGGELQYGAWGEAGVLGQDGAKGAGGAGGAGAVYLDGRYLGDEGNPGALGEQGGGGGGGGGQAVLVLPPATHAIHGAGGGGGGGGGCRAEAPGGGGGGGGASLGIMATECSLTVQGCVFQRGGGGAGGGGGPGALGQPGGAGGSGGIDGNTLEVCGGNGGDGGDGGSSGGGGGGAGGPAFGIVLSGMTPDDFVQVDNTFLDGAGGSGGPGGDGEAAEPGEDGSEGALGEIELL